MGVTRSVSLLVCVNRRGGRQPSCAARGSEALLAALQASAPADLVIEPVYCLGRCANGPAVRIAPGGPFFAPVGLDQAAAVLAAATAFAPPEKTC